MRFLRQTLLLVCLILPCILANAQAPIASDDAANGNEDSDIVIPVLGNDLAGSSAIDPASIDLDPSALGVDPSFTVTEGEFNVTAGDVTFTPVQDFFGPVTPIFYTVSDADNNVSNQASINVTVDPVNDAPTVAVVPQNILEDVASNVSLTIDHHRLLERLW